MRQIAFYGKGGIGKSTTTSNVSAALAIIGRKVMQIGCDPKADSTSNLTNGERVRTILDIIRQEELKRQIDANYRELTLEDLVHKGFNNVLCCEAGGPEPGIGCAGRGIITAIELLDELKAFEVYKPEFVFYDVLGDVVCGGFAMPIRKGLADEVYVVTSGEHMALYACNNIFKGIQKFAKSGSTRVGGIIMNARNTKNELDVIESFAAVTETKVIHVIPRDEIVQKSEIQGKTVMEFDETSDQAKSYLSLAQKIINNTTKHIPKPLDDNKFVEWSKKNIHKFN